MQTYIAILRGINVSAQKLIKMEDLRRALEILNFKGLKTYIQSGNIIFDAEGPDTQLLQKQIADRILKVFGFDVPVIVIELSELKRIIKNNPYVNQSDIDLSKVHITFLSEPANNSLAEKLDAEPYKPDTFAILDRAVYLHIPVSYGTTKLSNNFFEKKLKATATTRNWKTVNELLNIAENTSR